MMAWALRDRNTGLYLPWGVKGRSNSFAEFTSVDRPRLLNSLRSAQFLAKNWIRGPRDFVNTWSRQPINKQRATVEIEIVQFMLTPMSVRKG